MKISKKQIAYNRTRRTDRIKYIVVHDTGNPDKGADADRHFNYFNSGNRGSSADIFVDDTQALQVNDYNTYYSWHCGDGGGKYGITNNNSVGVEMCINADGDYDKTFANTVEVVKQLMEELGIDADHVVRHYDASRKNCPQTFSGNDWARWKEFKEKLTESEELTMSQYEELKKAIEDLKPMIYNYIDDNMPSWAKPTIQKLMDKGILVGDDEGKLGLTDDMLRIVTLLDRAGAFG